MTRKPHNRRNGAKPTRDVVLGDVDREMLNEQILMDADIHARKLCGRLPYSLAEVKPMVSAAVIFRLIGIARELLACKSVRMRQALERELEREKQENMRIRREMQRWEIEPPLRHGNRELPFREGA